MMSRYKPTGWVRDNYRHSLAARGFKSRRAFDAIAMNYPASYSPGMMAGYQNQWEQSSGYGGEDSFDYAKAMDARKGNRPTTYIRDPETGELKSLKHVMSALRIPYKQKNKGSALKTMLAPEVNTQINPDYDTEAILAAKEMEVREMQNNVPGGQYDTMPTVSSSGLDRTASPTSGRRIPEEGSVPTFNSEEQLSQQSGDDNWRYPKDIYGDKKKQNEASIIPSMSESMGNYPKPGFVEVPVQTMDVFEVPEMEPDQ